ncbi:hypothetical protein Atoyac13_44 [Aeromonas phage Atoyac13]|uniref:Uncharacterized protein n=1 Tax=Aeromonas phage Atoyac1 TaxID=2767547 RepID=A0A866D1V9_9CAUD|nr:hypothetical protein Atoyac1_44 [Aeromonas phage Atoyac1]QOC54270.1 hypothetical protein Atoyac10_44 [Aeromonas phage Atoyac10]QOC54316.1 hypothetical protein Atoyac13_44 [Aeromonas phage Atoyac13]QOC54362.1 hypothetical protein Atoyac14_44 [Aeromonas phage Atoyac14]QOC54458.1 hypothetical protein Atoyac23_44 [Aeromonas phage Atoyac23]
MSNNTATEKVLHRLSPAAYAELERKLPPPVAGSEQQTAFNLGVQHVLHILRQGFVA